MSLHCEQRPAYMLRCDRCGRYSWQWRLDETEAIEAAKTDGWKVTDEGKAICDDCQE